jgi:RNA polymerase sigma-70 factor (ECF subfamily)
VEELPAERLEHLVRRAVAGDPGAWRELVAAFAPRVQALLVARCRDPDLAEEITQAVFVTIAQKLASYRDLGRFRSWVFQIAMNRLRDEVRRRGRHAKAAGGTEDLELLGGAAHLGYQDASPEALKALGAALSALNEAERQVVHLRHMAGMSYQAIADLHGEPVGTLLARHHRAMAKLRQGLEESGITLEDLQ